MAEKSVDLEFVTFDVIGTKFRVLKTIFDNYPTSLLHSLVYGKVENLHNVVKLSETEFYVQRSPEAFKQILQYMVCEKLHVPSSVCGEQLIEEFSFWGIHFKNACTECANDYAPLCNISDHQVFRFTDDYFEENFRRNLLKYLRRKIWMFVEYPTSSIPALVFSILSLFFILLSIVNVVLISVPEMQFCPDPTINSTDQSESLRQTQNEDDSEDMFKAGFKNKCTGTLVFFILDLICMAWFSLELLLRLISCPNCKTCITSPMFLVDVCAILPFYVELLLWATNTDEAHVKRARTFLMFLRILRTIRIFRICKLARYMLSIKILGQTLRSATKEFNMLLIFILMTTFVFSNFLYQFEREEPNSMYSSIPASFWWCIVTLTTVGYGDMTPHTIGGKIFASFACIFGILIMAFPVAILVEKFMSIYKQQSMHAKYTSQLKKKNN